MSYHQAGQRMLLAFCWLAPALYGADVPLAQQAKNAMERGAFDEALGIAKRMLAANPRDVNALNIEGLALTGRGDLQQAADRFEAALRIDPGFQPARKNLAIDQLTLKQPEAAEKNLTILLKQTPRDPVIRMYLGELAFRRKEYAAATDTADLAINCRALSPRASSPTAVRKTA